jgi:DNA-binding transcriptional ArsR family regulator
LLLTRYEKVKMDELSAAFAALADPSRRALLQRLAHGPATSGQLAELLSVSRPATSQHLRVLHDSGLVTTTPIGRHRWQELGPAPIYLVENWTGRLVETWAGAPTLRTNARHPLQPKESP